MLEVSPSNIASQLSDLRSVEALDFLSSTIQVLTKPEADDGSPCIMHRTIPPGVMVPMHSHPDLETFILGSGKAEELAGTDCNLSSSRIEPGEIFHVPHGAKHAWRNQSQQSAAMIMVAHLGWAGPSRM